MTCSCIKRILATALLCAFFLIPHSSWAEGSLTLIARTDEGRLKIVLNEENGEFFGVAREGWMGVTALEAYHEDKEFILIVGNDVFTIERWDLGRFKTYGGVVQDQRGISAQAESLNSHLSIAGTIENDMNRLVEFEVLVNRKEGTFELTWGKNTLFLKRTTDAKSGGPGRCEGGLIKMDSELSGRFWCKSSGSLQDVFFKDPDHILAWIVLPFVK